MANNGNNPFQGVGQNFNDFIQNLVGNPFIAAGTRLLFGGSPIDAIMAAISARDVRQTEALNESNQEYTGQQRDVIDTGQQALQDLAFQVPRFRDPTTGQIIGPDFSSLYQDSRRGNGLVRGLGKEDVPTLGPILDLPTFNTGQSALDAFLANLPTKPERTIKYNPIATSSGTDLFGSIQGLGVLPETDLSSVLGARLQNIGQAGAARESQQRQEVAALAPQFGGLEGIRGALSSIGFQEGANRARESADAVAQTRSEELAAKQFVSKLAADLGTSEAQLNNAIKQFNENARFTIGNANIGRELGIAQTLSSLSGAAAADDIQRSSYITDAFLNSLGKASNLFGASTQSGINAIAAQVPLLQQNTALATSFLPYATPGLFQPDTGGSDSGFSLDLGTILGGTGAAVGAYKGAAALATAGAGVALCIDGEAWIHTPTGDRKLKEIELGDVVYDWYENQVEVVDKSYGKPWPQREKDFIRVQTDKSFIITTRDHLFNGKPISKYAPGQEIPTAQGSVKILSIIPCEPVDCGDLKLANGNGYIAQDMLVNSMFIEFEKKENQE